MRSSSATSVTDDPSARNTPASSTPMYPPPTMATRRGSASRPKNSSEVMPSAAPGTGGTIGLPPVAMTIWSAS